MTVTPALDFGLAWDVTKNLLLPAIAFGIGWALKKLSAIETRQVAIEERQMKHEHILIGVDGRNGLRSDVKLVRRRVDAIEDRNIAIDAVTRSDREKYPGPDRRIGARRMLDVVREAQDERQMRITGEHECTE
jgi:hypothetical protein